MGSACSNSRGNLQGHTSDTLWDQCNSAGYQRHSYIYSKQWNDFSRIRMGPLKSIVRERPRTIFQHSPEDQSSVAASAP